MSFSVVTDYSTTLTAPMTSTQLTLTVNSIQTNDATPHTITTSDLGDGWYLMIAPGTAHEEVVKVTAVAAGSGDGGTFTIDASGRGLAFYGNTDAQGSGNAYAHNPADTVILSNVKNVYNRLVDRESTQSIGGVKTFTSVPKIPLVPTAPEDAASKDYVDDTVMAIGGITSGYVTQNGADPSLTVNVGSGQFIFGSSNLTFAGASAQAVTASQTNYVQLDSSGTVIINITGFITGNIPLATVITDGTDITGITDQRPFFTQPDTVPLVSRSFTYGATLSVGDPVRVDASSSNKLIKALGTAAANADGFVGVCLDAGVDTDTKKRVQIGGLITGLSGLTADAPVYLTDAGGFSPTAGTYKKSVGYAISSTAFVLTRTFPVSQMSGVNTDVTVATLNEAGTFFANTDITGAEAETLSAGISSNADSLHTHNKLVTSQVITIAGSSVNAATQMFATGFSDATADQIAIGVVDQTGDVSYTSSIGLSADFGASPYLLNTFQATSGDATDTGATSAPLWIGTDYWISDSATGKIYKNGSAVTISGTGRFGPLGVDNTGTNLLVLYSTTKIAKFSGIAGTTITNLNTDVTLDTTVTQAGFVYDDTNDQYVCVDTSFNLLRKFSSVGATISTASYTISDGDVKGTVLIAGRYYLAATRIANVVGAAATICNLMVSFIPTTMLL